jgi:hypothetical protein
MFQQQPRAALWRRRPARDPDPARAGRATKAMLGMRKLDIAALCGASARLAAEAVVVGVQPVRV